MASEDRYTYRLTWSEDDGEYVALCAELPSLGWLANTPEAALRGVRKVVAEVVCDLQAENEPVPAPLATRSYSGRFVVRVPEEVHRAAGDSGRRIRGQSQSPRERQAEPLSEEVSLKRNLARSFTFSSPA